MKESAVTIPMAIKSIKETLGVSQRVVLDLIGMDASSITKNKDTELQPEKNTRLNRRLSALIYVLGNFPSSASKESMYYSLTHSTIKIDPSSDFEESFRSLIIQNDTHPALVYWTVTKASLDYYNENFLSPARKLKSEIYKSERNWNYSN
jgi:hypothetical protein